LSGPRNKGGFSSGLLHLFWDHRSLILGGSVDLQSYLDKPFDQPRLHHKIQQRFGFQSSPSSGLKLKIDENLICDLKKENFGCRNVDRFCMLALLNFVCVYRCFLMIILLVLWSHVKIINFPLYFKHTMIDCFNYFKNIFGFHGKVGIFWVIFDKFVKFLIFMEPYLTFFGNFQLFWANFGSD
jgi:hypothetical protein